MKHGSFVVYIGFKGENIITFRLPSVTRVCNDEAFPGEDDFDRKDSADQQH